ncbi:MAG: type I-C CRISPR-associated endonuclease Cas1 [Methanoregulaceae archaeon]|nr:type I-C CRISPR-associated endonuclease Cas1 [Methanoregulaceae archaeon]
MTRQFLNTLYIGTEGAHARLENDQVKVELEGEKLLAVPIHHLGAMVIYGVATVSPPLFMRFADEGRTVVFLDRTGRFRARLEGKRTGNILLRKAQYDYQSESPRCLSFAKNVVAGKIQNSRQVLMRAARDAKDERREDLEGARDDLADYLQMLPDCATLDMVRGIEGTAAQSYFGAFDSMITNQRTDFRFDGRSRRPPRDRVNALLSFVYSVCTSDCVSALESAGLDPQYGILHAVRPGRPALALDLIEEFRALLCDRLVLNLINRKQITSADVTVRAGGAVILTDDGRKKVLVEYQRRKQTEVAHALFSETVPMGLLPFIQARLMARVFRGDVAAYVPYQPVR